MKPEGAQIIDCNLKACEKLLRAYDHPSAGLDLEPLWSGSFDDTPWDVIGALVWAYREIGRLTAPPTQLYQDGLADLRAKLAAAQARIAVLEGALREAQDSSNWECDDEPNHDVVYMGTSLAALSAKPAIADTQPMRLEGRAAMDALYRYLVGVNHVHTQDGIVYASAIHDWLERISTVEWLSADAAAPPAPKGDDHA